jgi:hypothetical protein
MPVIRSSCSAGNPAKSGTSAIQVVNSKTFSSLNDPKIPVVLDSNQDSEIE